MADHYEPSARLAFVWEVYLLQEGGYPFKPNDLNLREWKSLGEFRMLRKELETKR